MIPRTASQVLDLSADDEINYMIIRDSGHSRFPLIDSENEESIVGVVIAKDIYAALLRDGGEPWKNLKQFARDSFIVPESQKVARLFDDMRSKRAHMALVIDEYGALAGIVTLEDLLEEIVGEIEDETDTPTENIAITQLDTVRWEADGLASLSDAERITGLIVPDELDANTLSGMIVAKLGEIPEVDNQVIAYGFRFTVRSIENHRDGSVLKEQLDNDYDDTLEQDSDTPAH